MGYPNELEDLRLLTELDTPVCNKTWQLKINHLQMMF